MKKFVALLISMLMMCTCVFAETISIGVGETKNENGFNISFEHTYNSGYEYAVIKCDGNANWTFEVESPTVAMVGAISDCYVNGDRVYIVVKDVIKAIDIKTGKLIWEAPSAGNGDLEVDKYGNVYNTAFDGLDLRVISKDGELLYTRKSNSVFARPFKLEIKDNTLFICYEDYYGYGDYYDEERGCAIDTFDISAYADTSVSGYTDVYSNLSSNERKALFDDFLYDIASLEIFDSLRNFDSRTATDKEIAFMLECLCMDTDFPAYESGNPYSENEFTKITQRYFGRKLDYTKFEIDHEPTFEDYGYDSVYYKGKFYLCAPQRGSAVGLHYMGKETHLYELGGNKYYASFKMTGSEFEDVSDTAHGAIVTKREDGTYKLDKIGGLMTKAELDAMVNPSDWAKAELEKADKEELIPELDGEPFMTESASRLQFAQLAVNLAEKVTGKKLTAASDTTFDDCDDEAVLKAYKAGIINGVSEKKFAPNDRLTREQLATMIWRTVDYIQSTTKKEKLTAGGTLSSYADASDVSDYAKEAVASLAENEIMKGTSETELSPKGSCTVEQSVILIYRTYNKIK